MEFVEDVKEKLKMKVPHNTCLIFVTHQLDDDIIQYIKYLKSSACGIMDFYVLYDSAHGVRKAGMTENVKVWDFDSDNIIGFFHQRDKRLPNPLVLLCLFAKTHPYNHYMLMENDIVLKGDFHKFLNTINDNNEYDYIHIETDKLGGPEHHWPILYIKDSPFEWIYFAWCQIFYVSRRYLQDLDTFTQVNHTFNYEFLLPTMAYNNTCKYKIRSFESLGYSFDISWGPTEEYEKRYAEGTRDNIFYHPVKNLNAVKSGPNIMETGHKQQ
ncbi:MAG: hypothetical protein ACI4T9_09750 [Prevotella sp.]